MRRAPGSVWFCLALAWASPTRADDLGRLEMTSWAALDGEERPFRYLVSLRAEREVEAVVDRRLLRFEVRPGGTRRRYRCRHPRAPRSARTARTRTLAAGETWREWVDLRMYCVGRALRALRSGAEVRPGYGWRRPSARRWVARVPETSRREWTAGLTPEPFEFPGLESREAVTRRLDDRGQPTDGAAEIRLTMASRSASSVRGLSFHVAVRASAASERIYLRPESFEFEVHGPSETFSCRLPSWGGAPVADLYRRVTTRAAWHERLDASAFCPEGSFDRPGLYEVRPTVSLTHDGARWGFRAVTGRFVGPLATVRILSGREYVEQRIER